MTIRLPTAELPTSLQSIMNATALPHAHVRWEQAQEAAMRAFQAEDLDGVVQHWRRALQIAHRHFAGPDPRRAASLTNHGFAERRLGRLQEGTQALRQALEIWDQCRQALHEAPAAVARGRRPADVIDCFGKLIRMGSSTTLRILNEDDPPTGRFELWLEWRPALPCRFRCMLGAVLLIVAWPAEHKVLPATLMVAPPVPPQS